MRRVGFDLVITGNLSTDGSGGVIPAMLAEHLGKPLSAIPDPFEKYDSFAAHNNAMLRAFLDRFGFEYDFVSATDRYASGAFDVSMPRRRRK